MTDADNRFFIVDESADTLNDLALEVEEKHQDIERCINELNSNGNNTELLNNIFRCLHTIKGDAKMCRMDPMANFVHHIENMLQLLRSGEIDYTDTLGEVILLCSDRALTLSQEAQSLQKIDISDLEKIQHALIRITNKQDSDIKSCILNAMAVLSGNFTGAMKQQQEPPTIPYIATTYLDSERFDDLDLYWSLVKEVEMRHPLWHKRTEILIPLAIGMNAMAGNPIDFFQLEVAVVLHDVGMVFLPDSTWLKQGKFTPQDRALMERHPLLLSKLVTRMHHWGEASTIIRQHHERIDGKGYPQGLSENDICDGARIMAICDAFYAMTHQRSDRITRKSVFRAVVGINDCAGKQFCRQWVGHFNTIVRAQQGAWNL